MAAENFTTYTEVDPNTRITVTPTEVSAYLTIGEDAWVYDDKDAAHFGAAFDHDFDFWIDQSDLWNRIVTWGLSNYIEDAKYWDDNTSEAAYCYPYRDTLIVKNAEDGTNDTSIAVSYATWYYCTAERSNAGATLDVRIYSDEPRTNLLDTITVTLTGARTYRYIFAVNSYNADGSNQHTRKIANLDLNEVGGVTLVVQDSECIVESESPALTQHQAIAVAGSESIVESDTVTLVQHQVLAVGGSECVVASEQPALTQHHVLAVAASECLVESEGPSLTQHHVLVVQDSANLVESDTVALTQHHVLAVAGSECVVESDNVTLVTYELQLVVQDSRAVVTSESPSLTQHHVLVVADAECLVVSEEPTLTQRELLVLADLVCLVVSESPVLALHYTSSSVIRRGPSAGDTRLRRGPGSTDGTIRRPSES